MAFAKAKQLVFTAFTQYLDQSLFQIQKESSRAPSDDDVHVLKNFRLMLNRFNKEHNLTEDPIESISKVSWMQ